jgi:hypothetical protein
MKFEYYPAAPGVTAEAQSNEGKSVAPRTVVYRGRTVLEAFEKWIGE